MKQTRADVELAWIVQLEASDRLGGGPASSIGVTCRGAALALADFGSKHLKHSSFEPSETAPQWLQIQSRACRIRFFLCVSRVAAFLFTLACYSQQQVCKPCFSFRQGGFEASSKACQSKQSE